MGSTQSQKMPGGSGTKTAPPSGPWSSDMATHPSRPAASPRPNGGSGPGSIYRDGLSGGGFQLSAPVGPGAANRPRDVYHVESVLSGSGLLGRAPGSVFKDDTVAAIGEGQHRLNRDHVPAVGRSPLKVDGLIMPEGPTQTATRTLARQVSDLWKVRGEGNKTVSPHPPKKTSLANPAPRRTQGDDINASIKRMQKAMSADQTSELHRLADGLSRSAKPGPAANDISEAINKDGTRAIVEFSIIRDRLAERGTPEQVKALEKAVMGGVSEKGRKSLKQLLQTPKPLPIELSLENRNDTLSADTDNSPKDEAAKPDNPHARKDKETSLEFQNRAQKSLGAAKAPEDVKRVMEALEAEIPTAPEARQAYDQGVKPDAYKLPGVESAPENIQNDFEKFLKDNPKAGPSEVPPGLSMFFRGPDDRLYEKSDAAFDEGNARGLHEMGKTMLRRENFFSSDPNKRKKARQDIIRNSPETLMELPGSISSLFRRGSR